MELTLCVDLSCTQEEPSTHLNMAKKPRHRNKAYKKRRQAADESAQSNIHPLSDPLRPVPNLKAADAFEYYYEKQQLVHSGPEWARFISTLHKALPVTFRVQPHGALGDECRRALQDLVGKGGLPEMTPLHWCSSYSVPVSKEELKSSHDPALSSLQAFLTKWAALGACTRQAIESMVPVALLQVEPHHRVMDMCASPGSKTTQAIEALFAQGAERATGFMVANDFSPMRCQMLLRRCAALGEMSERLVVTCHPAQSLPRLPVMLPADTAAAAVGGASLRCAEGDHQRYASGCYDRIICDVPCSGDGTTRKNPSIWHRCAPCARSHIRSRIR